MYKLISKTDMSLFSRKVEDPLAIELLARKRDVLNKAVSVLSNSTSFPKTQRYLTAVRDDNEGTIRHIMSTSVPLWIHVDINAYFVRLHTYVNIKGTRIEKLMKDIIYTKITESVEYALCLGSEILKNHLTEDIRFDVVTFYERWISFELNILLFNTRITGEFKIYKPKPKPKPLEGTIEVLQQDYTMIKCKNKLLSLAGIPIANRKVFDGEVCSFCNETGTLEVVKRQFPKKVLCKLVITNKVIHKYNSRGFPYYMATPLDKRFPKCLVTVNNNIKDKQEKDEYYVSVDYTSWLETFPLAALRKVVGKVGNEQDEYNRILNFYGVDQRRKRLTKKHCAKRINRNTRLFDLVNYHDMVHKYGYVDMRSIKNVVAIDPAGCKDMDDALSVHRDDGHTIFGVHIADVSFWVEYLELEEFMNKQGFTVYKNVNGTKNRFNIFPDVLAEHLFSLLQGQDRLALSMFIKTKDPKKIGGKRTIVDITFKKVIIKVAHNLSYEKADELLNKPQKKFGRKDKQLGKVLKRLKFFFGARNSHQIVSRAMVKCNSSVIQFVKKSNTNPLMIARITGGKRIKLKTTGIKCQKTTQFLGFYLSEQKAKYEEVSTSLLLRQRNPYCHFTSPIRRTVDIYNHIAIKKAIDVDYEYKLEADIKQINKWGRQNKAISWEITLVDMLYNQIKSDREYTSYVVSVVPGMYTLYCPELEFMFKKKVVRENIRQVHYNLWQKVEATFVLTDKPKYDVVLR